MKSVRTKRLTSRLRRSGGFSLVEVLVATVILLIGLVGIAQLVPASLLINQKGRLDSTSLVFAQRVLDEIMSHPLTDQVFFDTNTAAFYSLGDASQPDTTQGNNVIWVSNRPFIDFSGPAAPNYSFTYFDTNDPFGVTYDVRWGVVTHLNGSAIVSRRFFVGVRQQSNGSSFVPAVTLDATLQQ